MNRCSETWASAISDTKFAFPTCRFIFSDFWP
jgi:hypothetical protein